MHLPPLRPGLLCGTRMTRQAAGRQEGTKARKQGIEKNGVRQFEIGDWKFDLERNATLGSEGEGMGTRPYLGSAWKRATFRSDIAQGWVYIMHKQEARQSCPKGNRIPREAFLITSPKQSTLIGYGNWCSHFTETLQNASPSQFKVKPDYTTVVDCDRRYVEVSGGFCKLVGYQRQDLIGRQYDDLSAPNTNDIPVIFDLFMRLRYMHGLWMLVSRNGARILVRYESWLRPDALIQGNVEVIGAGY